MSWSFCARGARRGRRAPSHWRTIVLLALLQGGSACLAGPYDEPGVPGRVVDPNNSALTIVNPEVRAWADGVVAFNPAPGVTPANGDPAKALGPIKTTTGGETVSLGDLDAAQIAAGAPPGSIALSFGAPLRNGPGWDLAVFENAFSFLPPDANQTFAELAFVEVSSNGVDYARFPSVSLTTTLFTPFGPAFAGIDPSDVHNLAGKHVGLVGTPFDFDELTGLAAVTGGLVDPNDIRFVRLVDIPGSGAFVDSQGHPILEAWPTTDLVFGNGGLDLDAVGARYPVPEPSGLALAGVAMTLGATVSVMRSRANRQAKP